MAEPSVRSTVVAEEHEYRYYYSWLEDYLKRLEGKEAYREFQECYSDTPEHYALVASLAA